MLLNLAKHQNMMLNKSINERVKGIYWLFTRNLWCPWNLEDYNLTKESKLLIVFDDMKTDMEANKKKCYSDLIVHARQNTHYFTHFYITIVFQTRKRCKTKSDTFFYHVNAEQIASNHSPDIEL